MAQLQSALDHYRRQQKVTALGVIAARRVRFDTLERLLAVVTLFQMTAAEDAAAAVPLILAEQGMEAAAEFTSVLPALLGSASDGRSMSGLLDFSRGRSVTEDQFDRIVSTQLQDVARQATAIEMAARPQVTSYVRVLVPPSCSRCAILAGRVYRWNEGFLRHPRCDCQHVVSGREASDLTSSPTRYFRSLDKAEQDKIFTNAGAEAIRLGADPGKVVNARRGMRQAQVYGQDVVVTTEGTTRRGAYSIQARAEAAANGQRVAETTTSKGRRGAVANYRERRTQPRLMPESILEHAENRDDAVRLLTKFGYFS